MTLRPIARLLLLPMLCSAGIAGAQNLYKWVDENGKITYSDQPPIGKVKSQETLKIMAPSNPGAAKQMYDSDSQLKKRQEDAVKKQADTAKKEELESAKRESCTRARGEMRALRDNVPMVKMTESGERVVLDQNAREESAKRLETFVEENCGQPG